MRLIRPVALVLLALNLPGAPPADAQTFQDVIFHANLDEHTGYSDVWGYTAANGDEYALLGTWNGVAVINVTDPSAPYESGFLPGTFSTWRDIKTYQERAYVTNESGGGLAIIELADPENPVALASYTGFDTAHNLFIDEVTARCFIAGANLGSGGVRILSLADPLNPVEIGSWETDYVHDVVASGDRLYASAIFVPGLVVLNVANPAAIPAPISTIGNYPSAFTHNAAVDADGLFVMTTDELVGASIRMWDVAVPPFPETDSYRPNPAGAPHNVHLDGSRAFVSHYTAGVRVVDISNPSAIQELGFYDTYPANNGNTFSGCWGVFPHFGTNQDLFVASDIQTGLYVLEYRGPLGTLVGQVTRTGSPGVGVAEARVAILETGVVALSDAAGAYSLLDTGGTVTAQVSAFGHVTKTVPVTITAGTAQVLDVTLDQVPSASVSGAVLDLQTALPLAGATVEVLGTPLLGVTDASGAYQHPAVPAGSYSVRAATFGHDRLTADLSVSFGESRTLDFALLPSLAAEDFEAANAAWSVSGGASTGQWERADPEGTSDVGVKVQPEDDHTANGVNAWVTGPLRGAAVGQYDVDGGATVLTSPLYDVSGMTEPRASYHRWYSTGIGNPSVDTWTVEVSSDAGGSWALVESLSQPRTQWILIDVAVDSLVVPSSQIVFRFTARDTGVGSITEAAVDDFMVYDTHTVTGTDAPGAGFGEGGLRLSQGFPNPFRAEEGTRLALALPERTRVEAAVYDVAGRHVATIARGVLPAGPHQFRWDGRGDDGTRTAAGVYFLRLASDRGSRSRKLVILR